MPEMSENRRKLLLATAGAGGAAGIATAFPFLASLAPSQRAQAAGAPVDADVGKLPAGQMMTVEWRGKPVWVLRRTPEMLAALALEAHEGQLADPASEVAQQPGYAANRARSINPEYLVVVGICTHLGCSPTEKLAGGGTSGLGDDWPGGFLCPCHGSIFDLAGRVFTNQPAPTNLEVPPHRWLSATRLVIGEDSDATAV